MNWYCIVNGASVARCLRMNCKRWSATARPNRRITSGTSPSATSGGGARRAGTGTDATRHARERACGNRSGYPAGESYTLTGVPGKRPSFSLAMQQAWDHMKAVLFFNASFTRWMGMAFCVWISIAGVNEPYLAGEALLQQVQPDPTFIKSRIEACTTPNQMLSIYSEMWEQMSEKAREVLTPAVLQTALASG